VCVKLRQMVIANGKPSPALSFSRSQVAEEEAAEEDDAAAGEGEDAAAAIFMSADGGASP